MMKFLKKDDPNCQVFTLFEMSYESIDCMEIACNEKRALNASEFDKL